MAAAQPQLAIINVIRTPEENVRRIDEVFSSAMDVFGNNLVIVDAISKLRDFAHEMTSWLHEYDYSPTVQGNGFRSILEAGLKLIQFGVKTTPKTKEFVKDFEKMTINFANGINYVIRLRSESNNNNGSLELSKQTLIDFFLDYIDADEQLEVLFTNCGMWELDLGTQKIYKAIYNWKAFRNSSNLSDSFKTLVNDDYRRKSLVKLSKTVDIHSLKSNLDIFISSKFINRYYPNSIHGRNVPEVQKTVVVPRQRRFVIEMPLGGPQGPRLARRPIDLLSKVESVECRLLLQPKIKPIPG